MRPSLSVIIPSRDEGCYLASTIRTLLADLTETDEVIVVDDGSVDGSAAAVKGLDARVQVLRQPVAAGPAAARNRGAQASYGDVLVFSDAHVVAPPGWSTPLLSAVSHPDVGLAGPALYAVEHPNNRSCGLRFCDEATNLEWLPVRPGTVVSAPVLPGFFLVVRREIFQALGGFDPGIIGYGMEDPEISLHVWLRGWRCVVVQQVAVGHIYDRGPQPYQQDWATGLHNVLRFGLVHYSQQRLARLLACYADDDMMPDALSRAIEGDAIDRRAWLRQVRLYDDDWYFDTCNARPTIGLEAGSEEAPQ